MTSNIFVFTDGSCGASRDTGGWATVVVCGESCDILHGSETHTTINRCELRAVVEGIRFAGDTYGANLTGKIVVYSDSEYTVKTASGVYKPRVNKDLWAGLGQVVETCGLPVEFVWIERDKVPFNQLCDKLAGMSRGVTKNMREEAMATESFTAFIKYATNHEL